MKKPNVLLVICDQMNPLLASAYGDKVAVMPQLDRLAEEGTVFEHAYCNSPLCTPSRASMMTGRTIFDMRCAYDNGSEFSSEIPTFAHMLNREGYRTILSGKMHFIGADQLHGFQERLMQDVYPEDFLCTPKGWGVDPESHQAYGRALYDEVGVSDWNTQIQYDEEAHFQALKRIRKLGRESDPFLLTVSYTNPHSPFMAPKRYYDLYEGVDIPLPEIPEDIEASLDFYNAYLAHDFGLYKPDEAKLREVVRSYYAQYTYIDDKLGELRAALEREELADDTIVIFISDHGEMMGQKGLFEKRTFFEASTRVPLVVSIPGAQQPARVSQAVSLVDLFPTFADWAGSEWPSDRLAGASLLPLLTEGAATVAERPLITEYYGESVCTPFRAVVSERLKYVHFPKESGRDMLFDLSSDPEENCNVIAESRYASAVKRLHAEVTDGYDYASFDAEIQQSIADRQLILGSVQDMSVRPWRHYPDVKDVMWHWLPKQKKGQVVGRGFACEDRDSTEPSQT
ncbi:MULTISPECIES: choline-sulfatase [unclassified Lentimonas]|uniref:choline-sulfatase n=1 Tax=unclassified Lentimonas TaxID=2630993 RepID=UPI00138A1066|nr:MULTISPECIES: choline-sulfatase [unclassified Lentimonas]